MAAHKLSAKQLDALARASTNPRFRFRTGDRVVGGTVADATAKALKGLGLFEFEGGSGWRPQAIGVWKQYRATAAGREIILIGGMLNPITRNI